MTARNRWCNAAQAQASHQYLQNKAVAVHGLRQAGDALLVPMRDEGGELWNLQTIAPDGTKRFLPGGRISGLFHRIGAPVVDRVAVAEGYATGASVAEATGIPVAVAFNCGNLEPVGRALRKKYPEARLIYAADNDIETEARIGRNPGIEAATAAAKATGGYLAFPDAGDFNDLARARSFDVAQAIGGAE